MYGHICTLLLCCADIDECATNASTCEQVCTNTIGGFLCSCFDGYRLNVSDNSTCDGEFGHRLLCSTQRRYSFHYKTSMSVMRELTTVTKILVCALTLMEITPALVMLDLLEMASHAMVTVTLST